MITIRDLIIAPYEIDVDKMNFTLVKTRAKKSSDGKDVEGTTKREVIGYYSSLGSVLDKILREKVSQTVPQVPDGSVIHLKTFLKAQEVTKNKLFSWFSSLNQFEVLSKAERDEVHSTPKKVLFNLELLVSGKKTADEEPTEEED